MRSAWDLPALIRPLPVRRQKLRRKPHLLPHSPALLEYILNSRFVVGSQVTKRFPQWLRTQRTTQWQLSNLVQLGYLSIAPVRSTSPNFPYVYYCTARGVRLINDTYDRLGSAFRHTAGEECKHRGLALTSVLHEVLLSELELTIHRLIGERSDLRLLQAERRYHRRDRRLRFQDKGRYVSVEPDAGFLLATGEGSPQMSQNVSRGQLTLIEFDNGSMPAGRFGAKLRRYTAWADSDAGARQIATIYHRFDLIPARAGFRLLVVAHDPWHPKRDQQRLAALYTQVLALPQAMRDRVWFTTAEALRPLSQHSPPLDAEIWWRGRDARVWNAQYSALAKTASAAELRRFIHNNLALMPRHALLPSPSETDINVPDVSTLAI